VLSAGASQTTVTMPWNNVDRITVRFDRDVVATVDSLTLYDSSGQGVSALGFRYLDGRTVEWIVPTLAANKYLINLDAAMLGGIADLALDGEWTTSSTTWVQGSGNGAAGGSFNFRFKDSSDFSTASFVDRRELVASPLFLEPASVVDRAFVPALSTFGAATFGIATFGTVTFGTVTFGTVTFRAATFGAAASVVRHSPLVPATLDTWAARFAGPPIGRDPAIRQGPLISPVRPHAFSTVRSEVRPSDRRSGLGDDDSLEIRPAAQSTERRTGSEPVRGWTRLRRRADAPAGDTSPAAMLDVSQG
jgi:hypothetical protein